jgi:hypothetical protein
MKSLAKLQTPRSAHLILLLVCLRLAAGTFPAAANEGPAKRQELRQRFEAASSAIRSKFDKDRADLGGKYVAALQRMEAGLQAKGELNELLAVREERELFAASGTMGSGGSPELVKIRDVYAESRAPFDAGEKEEMLRLMDAYIRQLEALQTELTRGGDIEEALSVRSEAERMRNVLNSEDVPLPGANPAPAAPEALARLAPVPTMNHDPADPKVFELGTWPAKLALPPGNYRIEGNRQHGDESEREIQLSPGSVFRGSGQQPRWMLGKATLVAREVEFNGFTLLGDLGSRLFFEKCQFKGMNLGKGGPWFGGRFMTRWQFRDCLIEGSFVEKWNSRHFGVQMVDCRVERVTFPPIDYDAADEPSELAGQDWAMVKNSHFRKCVIPVSVLSLLDECSFEECRFVDDPAPKPFTGKLTRTIYLDRCQWNVKALPTEFVVEQKPLSSRP